MRTSARQRLAELMRQTLADQQAHGNWQYRQIRPLYPTNTWVSHKTVVGDCSKGVQFLCRWADAPDPMQNGWGGAGNSSTIWLRLHHLWSARDLEVGDIVVFGPFGDEHAAMVLEPGTDPLLWSFGHQGAPNTVRLSHDFREKTFCKLPVVDPPPTPQDKLRAMTGFYAWVAWRLGEGPWRKIGAKKKSVRPDVPAVIPLAWWQRYAKFVRNRNKPNAETTA